MKNGQKRPKQLTFSVMKDIIKNGRIDEYSTITNDFAMVYNIHGLFDVLGRQMQPYLIDDYRFGWVVENQLTANVNLIDHYITKNQIVFIAPGTIVQPHSNNANTVMTGIGVSREMMREIFGNQLPSFLDGRLKDGITDLSEDNVQLLRKIFDLLWQTAKKKDLVSVRNSLIRAVISVYEQQFKSMTTQESVHTSHNQAIFNNFIQLVNKHCKQEHMLDFYASKLCITDRYLCSVVKEVSGVTAKQWIDKALVIIAKIMLRHEDKTVAQIADDLCFPNVSFFCQYFKRNTGMTPNSYREE
jgi:AraC family transcriptional activator of pobA